MAGAGVWETLAEGDWLGAGSPAGVVVGTAGQEREASMQQRETVQAIFLPFIVQPP